MEYVAGFKCIGNNNSETHSLNYFEKRWKVLLAQKFLSCKVPLNWCRILGIIVMVIATISFLFHSMQNLKMLAEDEREVSISRELHHLTIFTKLEFLTSSFYGWIIVNNQQ